MASGLYDKGREGFLDGTIKWPGTTENAIGDIRVMLVNVSGGGTTYTVDLANHQFLSSIPTGARFGDNGQNSPTSGAKLLSKTSTAGVAAAADTTLSQVGSALEPLEAIVLYQNSGDATTSRLIAYIDGISVTPTGTSDITIAWDPVNKIFKL